MKNNPLYGAILGDMAGSIYELGDKVADPKTADVNVHDPRGYWTDDTLMTLACAEALMTYKDPSERMKHFAVKYMAIQGDGNDTLGFGGRFVEWIHTPPGRINDSWGNGSVMRASPYMWADNLFKAIEQLGGSHRHNKSVAGVVTLHELYNYEDCMNNLDTDEPEVFEKFDVSTEGTMEFIEKVAAHSSSTHEAIKKAINCGGDTDTNASIVGELANYHYNDLTQADIDYVESKLPMELVNILHAFGKYIEEL